MSDLALKLIFEAKVKKAITLDLGNCGLKKIPEEVFELTSLEVLSLCNEYRDVENSKWVASKNNGAPNEIYELNRNFAKLKELKELYVGGAHEFKRWGITNIDSLKELTKLETLYLGNNHITEIDCLQKLIKLQNLNASGNQVVYIDPLKKLTQLSSLNLSDNQITDIEALRNLSRLKYLNLRNNQIANIEVLQYLSRLQYLNLRSNQIANIEVLQYLSRLQYLNLSYNQIVKIDRLCHLTQLITLDISSNFISAIDAIQSLIELTTLHLSDNQITNIEALLSIIEKGVSIDTSNLLFKNPNIVSLGGNPIISPPLEIIQRGNQAIIDYFEGLENGGEEYLYEAKMLILGEGGAGKTSFRLKLQDRHAQLPKEEDTTKGIDIEQLIFKIDNQRDFTINIWDFSGQEIYYATHQFFLTKRSLYILVDDTRNSDKNESDSIFNYWLQSAELFGGDSPLLIIQNEKGGRSKDIDFKSMQAQYGFIKEKYATDLKTCIGLDRIEEAIKYHIQQLPHIGEPLPGQWLRIRNSLIEISQTKAYISLNTYLELAKELGIGDNRQALTLSQYLHDLGMFLHFQEDSLLKKTIILQNEWATDAVYNILDDEVVKQNKGEFTTIDTTRIWSDNVYVDMQDELLAIMQKFELCYLLDHKKHTYLIPQLLSASTPDSYFWDNKENLQLRYQYVFMPKGILSRLIVRLHRYVNNREKAWKSGVNLERNGAIAEVREVYGKNEITIRVKGLNCRELLVIIAENIDKLNSLVEGVKVQKNVPCNCSTCQQLEEPYFFNYNDLTKRLWTNKDTIECRKEPFEDVPVAQLITDVLGRVPDFYSRIEEGYHERNNYEIKNSSNVKIFNNTYFPSNVTTSNSRLAIERSKASIYEQWWFKRILGGLLGGLLLSFILVFRLGFSFLDSFIACSLGLVSLLLFLGNPERRFFRAASFALASALSTVMLNLAGSFKYSNKNLTLALELLTDYSGIISITLILLAGCLFYLDYLKEKKSD